MALSSRLSAPPPFRPAPSLDPRAYACSGSHTPSHEYPAERYRPPSQMGRGRSSTTETDLTKSKRHLGAGLIIQ